MEQLIKKILIGYDFSSAARHAMAGTIELARKTGAELTVVTAVPAGVDDAEVERIMELSDYRLDRNEATAIGLEDIEKYVKADIEKFDLSGVAINYDVGSQRVDRMMLDTCDVLEGDLIVVGGVGSEGEFVVPIGTDTMRLVRHSRWPVLVARRSAKFPPRRILASTDFSEASRRAVGWAFDLGSHWNVPVEVLHVIKDDEATARSNAMAIIENLAPSCEWTLALRSGPAHKVIVEHARDGKFDLLSIGSLGRSRVMEVLIGGTTERVLRRLPCSVLMVKPDEFSINYSNPVG